MIRDLMDGIPTEAVRTDVCVIGAGAAGIVLALELARQGKTVTLLEGGGRLVEDASQQPYRSEVGALPHRGLHNGRIRALGGTTTLWGGQILELDASDFDRRPWVQESGWPFSKTELVPYYARALELEGLNSALHDDAAVWMKLGQIPPTFVDLGAYLSRWCPEPNFACLHGEKLERSERIHVWIHANAVALITDGGTAKAVRCRTIEGKEATFKADHFCFCLGAIESSRFFLQPRSGDLPWNDSGLLGRFFQDHIDCDAAVVEPKSKEFHRIFDAIFLGGYKYNPKLKLNATVQERCGLLQAGATFYSVSAADEALAQMKTTAKHLLRGQVRNVTPADLWNCIEHCPDLLRQTARYAIQHRAYHPTNAQVRMRVHCEQQPASASRIELSSERDALGLFRTRLSWQIAESELETIRAFVAFASRSLADLASITPDTELYDSDSGTFRDHCQDSFHHMGGMRMHKSARCGVVDPNLKLNGMNNAYVCSSAVFPTSGFSNPTHTLLALAVRLANQLATSC